MKEKKEFFPRNSIPNPTIVNILVYLLPVFFLAMGM